MGPSQGPGGRTADEAEKNASRRHRLSRIDKPTAIWGCLNHRRGRDNDAGGGLAVLAGFLDGGRAGTADAS